MGKFKQKLFQKQSDILPNQLLLAGPVAKKERKAAIQEFLTVCPCIDSESLFQAVDSTVASAFSYTEFDDQDYSRNSNWNANSTNEDRVSHIAIDGK